MTKKASNEAIIAALMERGTITAAAEAAGVSARTIHDRMKDLDFMNQYTAAKNDMLRSVCITMNGKIAEAVETIAEIMNDPEANAAVRLQAAQSILNTANKFTERLTASEWQADKKSNSWDLE